MAERPVNDVASCPSIEILAAYVDGMVAADERIRIHAHISRCDVCRELITEVALMQDREAAAPSIRREYVSGKVVIPIRRNLRQRILVAASGAAAAMALFVAGAELDWWRAPWRTDTPVSRLVDAVRDERVVEARLTGGFEYAPLRARERSRDPSKPGLALLAASADLEKRAGTNPSPENLHAWGVAQTLLGEYDAAVQTLTAAAMAAPGNAQLQSDLAATYLARAANAARPEDWPRGLAITERALALNPTQLEALFNRALALEALNLREQARAAWEKYLEADATSPWADEARRALAQLSRTRLSPWNDAVTRVRAGGMPPDGLIDLSPQAAREFGEQVLLGEWASATAAGRQNEAETLLDLAGSIGRELAARGGDAALAAHVVFIAARESTEKHHLARIHREWTRALDEITAYRNAEAVPLLTNVARQLSTIGAPLGGRAAAQLASAARASRQFGIVAAAVGPKRTDRCAVAQAERDRAVALMSVAEGKFAQALALYQRAGSEYARCLENGNEASVHALTAELLTVLGAFDRAWGHEFKALHSIDDVSQLRGRLLITYCGAELALQQGLPEAALHISRESAALARAGGHLPGYAEAVANVAKAMLALNRVEEAQAEVAGALEQLRALGNDRHRRFIEGELLITMARIRSRRPGAGDRELIDRALDHARAVHRGGHLPALLLASAHSYAAAGAFDVARQELEAGIDSFLGQLSSATDPWLRRSFRQTGWELYEELARLELDAGKGPMSALTIMLEGLTRVSSLGAQASAPTTIEQIQSGLGPNAVAMFVHAFGDRIATWAIGASNVRFHSATATAADLRRLQENLRTAIEQGRDDRVREVGARIYSLTLRAHERDVSNADRLRIICTPPLDQVAWSTLRGADGHLLIETKVLELARPGSPNAAPIPVDAPTVVLAAPDAASARLRLVDDEARSIASLRPNVQVVDASSADIEDVKAALTQARVLHYAGHAVSDLERPERSALLFRSDDPTRRLTARELIDIPGRLDLAVLTACQTASDPAARAVGSASLALVLRDAGIRIVIAAVGNVDDETAFAIGIAVHRHLATGQNAAEALRLAQLERARTVADSRWALFVVYT